MFTHVKCLMGNVRIRVKLFVCLDLCSRSWTKLVVRSNIIKSRRLHILSVGTFLYCVFGTQIVFHLSNVFGSVRNSLVGFNFFWIWSCKNSWNQVCSSFIIFTLFWQASFLFGIEGIQWLKCASLTPLFTFQKFGNPANKFIYIRVMVLLLIGLL